MNLDHDFVQVSKLSKDKKRSSPKMEHFFSPNSSGHLRSDAHQRQIIRGNADVDHTQTIGDTVKLLGDISPPPPPGFRPPWVQGKEGGMLAFLILIAHLHTYLLQSIGLEAQWKKSLIFRLMF